MPINKPAMPRFVGPILSPVPTWITPAGVLGEFNELSFVSIFLEVADLPIGTTSLTLQSGVMPAGLTFFPGTGIISGTLSAVTRSRSIPFTIRATSSVDNTFTDRIFSITVVDSLIPPHRYQVLIDTHAIQLFVDVAGNDSTGDGSFFNPYQTINPAVESITASGGAVIIGPGTFTINTENGLSGSPAARGFLTDYNNPISFFGTPNQTILKSNPLTVRDAHIWGCQNPNTEARGLIFHNMVGSRTQTFSVAMFSNTVVLSTPPGLWTAYGTIYNCVFVSLNDSLELTTASLFYDNDGDTTMTINNCSFQASGWQNSFSASANTGKFLNDTAANPNTWKLVGTQINTDFDVSFDVNWHIITNGDDNLNGVYSGSNAW